MHNAMQSLQTFERGNFTLQRYFRDIILDMIVFSVARYYLGFLIMDDNTRSDRFVELSGILECEYIEHVECAIYSSELYSIQHACLGRYFSQRTYTSRTMQDLKNAMKEKWNISFNDLSIV